MDWVNQTIRTNSDRCKDMRVETIQERQQLDFWYIATSVELANGLTKFYGKDLNRVRGHYFWLRRKLGIKKAIDTIKKIGSHEKRIAARI
jgi:hypothetical protein